MSVRRALGALGVLSIAIGLIVAWTDGTFSPAVVQRAGTAPWALRHALAGVANCAEVIPGKVYRGAQPTPEGYQELKKLGVKTIISLRELHSEREAVLEAGLEPIAIPLQADMRGSLPPTAAEVKRFLDIVTDPAKQPVFFHCAQGRDRTGTMCAIFRMEVDGWPAADAWDEMQAFGFNQIWNNLRNFVKGYQPAGAWKRVAKASPHP